MLQLDTEYSEWRALEAMKHKDCFKNVRQMVFETHMWTNEDRKADILLQNNGFPPQNVP